jgi:hypothetical protein
MFQSLNLPSKNETETVDPSRFFFTSKDFDWGAGGDFFRRLLKPVMPVEREDAPNDIRDYRWFKKNRQRYKGSLCWDTDDAYFWRNCNPIYFFVEACDLALENGEDSLNINKCDLLEMHRLSDTVADDFYWNDGHDFCRQYQECLAKVPVLTLKQCIDMYHYQALMSGMNLRYCSFHSILGNKVARQAYVKEYVKYDMVGTKSYWEELDKIVAEKYATLEHEPRYYCTDIADFTKTKNMRVKNFNRDAKCISLAQTTEINPGENIYSYLFEGEGWYKNSVLVRDLKIAGKNAPLLVRYWGIDLIYCNNDVAHISIHNFDFLRHITQKSMKDHFKIDISHLELNRELIFNPPKNYWGSHERCEEQLKILYSTKLQNEIATKHVATV